MAWVQGYCVHIKKVCITTAANKKFTHGTVVTELDIYVPTDMSDIVDTAIVYMITFVIEHQ